MKQIANTVNSPVTAYGPTSITSRRLCRLIKISSMATALRDFEVSVLTKDEMEKFFELQNFFIELESKCFDEAGFE